MSLYNKSGGELWLYFLQRLNVMQLGGNYCAHINKEAKTYNSTF